MCGVCDGDFGDIELIDLIKEDDIPNNVLLCDRGWSELSRIWGKYGWAKKMISSEQWRAVCNTRGYVKFGN